MLASVWSCQYQKEIDDSPWLKYALETEKYLSTALLDQEEGIAWKVMPDSASGPDISLYSGTPGVILFYLQLFESTGVPDFLEKATAGADFLLVSLPDTAVSSEQVGLYTGLAGIGYTLAEVYRKTGDERYKTGLVRVIDLLDLSAEKTASGIHWGQTTDIVYGAAGIGLFLHDIADGFDLPKVDSLSLQIGTQLLKQATHEPDGLRWKMSPYMDIHMDNFSHGTAGVAYFLLDLHIRTEDLRFLEAAQSAGNWLLSHSNGQGQVSHHLPGGEELYYQSWCHGPAGTSRLYYLLWDVTGDQKWMDAVELSAQGTMALGIDSKQTTGFWNNVGKCCGDVGVAEHYLWLYEVTRNQDYLSFAKKMTYKAIGAGTQSGQGLKWIHAENRRSPEQVAAQTGLMQGSAGVGLWFLQMDAFEKLGMFNFLPDKKPLKTP
ncbi:MAG: hypothetical protein Roseis2KO_57170 [Roseivirga sp.]